MSALALTEQEWARKMRDERSVKDKSYRRYWLGQEVGHFLRAKRHARCSVNTLRSYETTLCAFTLDHRDIESWDEFVGPRGSDLIVDFLQERWGEAADATLDNRTGAIQSFFAWAEDTGRIDRAPRVRRRRVGSRTIREAHELSEIRFIASQQDDMASQVAILLMGRLGFRKDDVRRFTVRDVDLGTDVVYIRHGKGGKPVELPIAFKDLREALYLWLQERPRDPDHHLLRQRGDKKRPLDPASVQRWWDRCLETAGVAHFPMHELRHSAGDRLWRKTGNLVLAQELLRHASPETTRLYLHPEAEDLRAGLRLTDEDEN